MHVCRTESKREKVNDREVEEEGGREERGEREERDRVLTQTDRIGEQTGRRQNCKQAKSPQL